jgi:hypothetical protein
MSTTPAVQRYVEYVHLNPTTGSNRRPGRLVDEEVFVYSVGPGDYWQQSGAAQFYCDQHVVPAQGVKGDLPVHLQGHAAGVAGHASADGVPDNLATSWNDNSDL